MDPLCHCKSVYNFGLPPNLTANSPLVTGSLPDNINSADTYFVCYMYYILYSSNRVSQRGENVVTKIIRKRGYVHSTVRIY